MSLHQIKISPNCLRKVWFANNLLVQIYYLKCISFKSHTHPQSYACKRRKKNQTFEGKQKTYSKQFFIQFLYIVFILHYLHINVLWWWEKIRYHFRKLDKKVDDYSRKKKERKEQENNNNTLGLTFLIVHDIV